LPLNPLTATTICSEAKEDRMTISLDEFKARLLANPQVKAEYDAFAPEFETKARAVRPRASKLPEQPPTADEVAAIKRGSRELAEAKFVTLKQLRHELDHRRQQPRAKKS
jgi:hypothetical protein